MQRFRLQAEEATKTGLGDVPVVRQCAEGENVGEETLAIILVVLFRLADGAGLADGRCGFFTLQFIVQTADNARGKQHEPGSRRGEYYPKYRRNGASGISADE